MFTEEELKNFLSELKSAISYLKDDYLSSIMDKVGIIDNKEIIKLLKVYNIDAGYDLDEEQKDNDNNARKILIYLSDNFFMNLKDLNSLEKFSEESAFGIEKFGILINSDPSQKFPFANKRIFYKNESERNDYWAKLQSKLEYFNVVFK